MKKCQVIETSNKELIPYKRYGEKTNDLSWLRLVKIMILNMKFI